MASKTYLVKVGDYQIPLKYMSLESYNATYSTSDLDSTRMADGTLKRTPLDHRVLKVEFTTPVGYLSDIEILLKAIRDRYVGNKIEKKVTVSAYVPEMCDYITQECYVPDITVTILENNSVDFIVDRVRIAFIGY